MDRTAALTGYSHTQEPAIGVGVKKLIILAFAPVPKESLRRHFPDAQSILMLLPKQFENLDPIITQVHFDPKNHDTLSSLDTVRAFLGQNDAGAVYYPYPDLWKFREAWIRGISKLGITEFFHRDRVGLIRRLPIRKARLRSRLSHSCVRAWVPVSRTVSKGLLSGCNNPSLERICRPLLSLFGSFHHEARLGSGVRNLLKVPSYPLANVNSPRITHWIGSLSPGGAERQLCNLLRGLNLQGYGELHLLTCGELVGSSAHYLPLLDKVRIRYSVAPAGSYEEDPLQLLRGIPFEVKPLITAVYRWLKDNPPDIFHTWMDYCNVIGGVAALMAGVPRIVLSTRNVSPLHFPYLYHHWQTPLYRLLAASNRVYFLNNSHNGARDYSEWLKPDPGRVRVILNGLDFSSQQRPKPEDAIRFRTGLGLDVTTPLVAGIFRFSPEKRPLFFVKILKEVFRLVPEARAVHAGLGPMEKEFRHALAEAGIAEKVQILGRREDIPELLSAADVLVLPSALEGTPNVLLEAQWFGCPPVTTDAGGAPDCVEHAVTGFVHSREDAMGMARNVAQLLIDQELRSSMSSRGHDFMEKKFGVNRMVGESIDFYKRILGVGG